MKNYRVFEDLNRVYRPSGSTTEAILVWHVATTLFHHQKAPPQQNNNPFKKDSNSILTFIRDRLISRTLFHNEESPPQQNNDPSKKEQKVALALSSYCYYLVAFRPELLPDEVAWSEKVCENVREEIFAIDNSSGLKPTVENRCNYAIIATDSGITWDENSVFGKGVKLAKELVNHDDNGTQVWNMLSEFWAEMLLFIAPSDNVEGHEKILEKEELITQLWALLTHAGILTRPPSTQNHNHGIEIDDTQPSRHSHHVFESDEITEV
ncbi:hypothetical protein LUZ62_041004 [Rhynchospora pubera]|uniref:Uncharacterized protein n=1 Tax=Rhynchospora pubera TaxID=906938 RepID=A0AAV8FGD6_9POAL|nr:hypothetical protein LUZ62_041004 [Rhynchospora pubera]